MRKLSVPVSVELSANLSCEVFELTSEVYGD